ncbi:MAG: HNH endonuclease [Fidelibacterota bacterium]
MGIQDKTELTKDEIAEIEEHLPGDYEDGVFGLDQIPPMRNLRRNRRIVREAQARYSAVCEACGDNLMKKYGLLGKGYVQFHHRKPLGDNPNPQLSSWKDLAPLCPNCHAMIHRTNPTMPVEQFKKEIIQSIKSS